MTSYFYGPWSHRQRNPENLARFRRAFSNKPCLYDLGAAGGTPPPFLFLDKELEIVNFEPDRRADTEDHRTNYAVAIGPSDFNRIYLNRRPTTSSLLEPNKRITDRYDWSKLFGVSDDIFETIAVEPIETHPLDDVVSRLNLPMPDFLKIDVQGLSLEVLHGAATTISGSVVGIDVEVEFLECYRGQRTMGAIHEYLYAQGFEIFRLKNLNPWYYKTTLPLAQYSGQDTFCDFVYFRNIDSISDQPAFWSAEKALMQLQLLLLYDLTDAAAAFFQKFQRHGFFAADTHRIEQLIQSWPGSIDFFHYPQPQAADDERMRGFKRLLAVSPLHIIRRMRSFTGTLRRLDLGAICSAAGKSIIYKAGNVCGIPPLRFFCPVCEKKVYEWLPFVREIGHGAKRLEPEGRVCPHCMSFERTRQFWLYLTEKGILDSQPRFLHFAPEEGLVPRLRAALGPRYVTTDICMDGVDRREDITHMNMPDDSFDFIYCSNVLEHIPDDRAAMAELFRILRPGGTAIIQVPIKGTTTYEDESITDPSLRAEHFGQADHVRYYGEDISDRLTAAGFQVQPFYMLDVLDLAPSAVETMNLGKRELIHKCTK